MTPTDTSKKLKIKPTDLVVFTAAIIAGGLTYFVARPQAETLKVQVTELKAKQAEAAQLEKRVNSLSSIANELPQYSKQIERLTVAYPKEEQSAEALVQIQTMAERSGMGIVTLAPGKGKGTELPVAVSLKGSYQALNSFFKETQSNIRPIIVKSMNVVGGTGKEQGLVTVTLTLTVPYAGTATVPQPQTTFEPLPTTQ